MELLRVWTLSAFADACTVERDDFRPEREEYSFKPAVAPEVSSALKTPRARSA
jgi:hypothetical protein